MMSASVKILHKTLIMVMLLYSPLSGAQTQATPEYQVKAVFLFHFTQFVEWPPASFPSADSPFIIGVYGENPFNSYLSETIAGEKVHGHAIVVQQYNSIEQVPICHILFINKSEQTIMEGISEISKRQSILTVGDAPDFLERGGMVRFVSKGNKVHIQINLEAAKNAKLDISSKLLRLVEITASK